MPNRWRMASGARADDRGFGTSAPTHQVTPEIEPEEMTEEKTIPPDPLLERVLQSGKNEILSIAELEKLAILRALRITSGNIDLAAKELGMGRATLYRRLLLYEDVDVLSFKS